MELNSLAKMERRREKRRGCLGWELTALLCTRGPSSNMLAGKLQFNFLSSHNEAVVCPEAGSRQLDSKSSMARIFLILPLLETYPTGHTYF
jgi:hypothetical protein